MKPDCCLEFGIISIFAFYTLNVYENKLFNSVSLFDFTRLALLKKYFNLISR